MPTSKTLVKHLVVTGTYICQKHLVVTGTYICQKFLKKNQLSRFTKKSIRNEKQNSTFGNDYNVDLAWVLTD